MSLLYFNMYIPVWRCFHELHENDSKSFSFDFQMKMENASIMDQSVQQNVLNEARSEC